MSLTEYGHGESRRRISRLLDTSRMNPHVTIMLKKIQSASYCGLMFATGTSKT